MSPAAKGARAIMGPEAQQALLKLALALAVQPPVRFSEYGSLTQVSRADITALRAFLADTLGIDWRRVKAIIDGERKAARRAAVEARQSAKRAGLVQS
jgi:hypothetical protein